MNKIFDNKTIIKNFDFCVTNELRCDYIKQLIGDLMTILEKFNNNAKTKSEQFLLELLQKIVEIRPYFFNYDGITDQACEIVPMITDIVLKAFHDVYHYSEPSEFYKHIEFFIEKSLKLNCHKNGKAILDLAEDYNVVICDADWLKIQSLVFSYDRLFEAAKRMETLICNTYFNLIEWYFKVFNDVDRYRSLGDMYNDKPENTELYKMILDNKPSDEDDGPWLKVPEEESKKHISETPWSQANDEAYKQEEEKPKDDFYSRPRDTWTTEEELKFDKQLYDGMAKHLEKKFKEEANSKLPDPRDFPKEINPYHPDEIKKQLKDSYPITPGGEEIGGLCKDNDIDDRPEADYDDRPKVDVKKSVKRLKKIRRKL